MGTLFVIQHRTFRTHAGVQCLLWSKSAVLIDPAASKETVMHHALGKQKNGDGQPNQKQDLSNLEPGRLFPCRDCLIRILSHLSYLSAKSGDCRGTTLEQLITMPEVACHAFSRIRRPYNARNDAAE
jgi:hypothetical protein